MHYSMKAFFFVIFEKFCHFFDFDAFCFIWCDLVVCFGGVV